MSRLFPAQKVREGSCTGAQAQLALTQAEGTVELLREEAGQLALDAEAAAQPPSGPDSGAIAEAATSGPPSPPPPPPPPRRPRTSAVGAGVGAEGVGAGGKLLEPETLLTIKRDYARQSREVMRLRRQLSAARDHVRSLMSASSPHAVVESLHCALDAAQREHDQLWGELQRAVRCDGQTAIERLAASAAGRDCVSDTGGGVVVRACASARARVPQYYAPLN
eukprot:COSAG01_NODE_8635_length_2713_cov_1.084927_1_plen_222_part_00